VLELLRGSKRAAPSVRNACIIIVIIIIVIIVVAFLLELHTLPRQMLRRHRDVSATQL
jgi:t-SNARE complex subunit (syntaxin)